MWSLSKYLIDTDRTVLTFLVMMWDDEMPHVERKWSEWHRHCDVVLGYYWPSDGAWRVIFEWSWIIMPWLGIPVAELDCMKFHHTTQNGVQFKLMNCFWNFPLNIFGPGLIGHWNHRKRKQGLGWGGGPLYPFIKGGKRETQSWAEFWPRTLANTWDTHPLLRSDESLDEAECSGEKLQA